MLEQFYHQVSSIEQKGKHSERWNSRVLLRNRCYKPTSTRTLYPSFGRGATQGSLVICIAIETVSCYRMLSSPSWRTHIQPPGSLHVEKTNNTNSMPLHLHLHPLSIALRLSFYDQMYMASHRHEGRNYQFKSDSILGREIQSFDAYLNRASTTWSHE